MKKCLSCDIFVGGNVKSCPLCRNSLNGEDSHNNWPQLNKLKKQAFFYKLQLFLVLTIVVVSLSLDFLMDINNDKHYSLMIAISLVVIEIVVRGFIKKSIVITKIISVSALHISLLLILIGWYYNFINLVIVWILPIIMAATLTTDFVLALIDKTENAMVYLLMNVLITIVAYAVIVVEWRMKPLIWSICLMLGIIAFIGMAVFKGPKLISEIQKRMNF